MGDFPWWPLVKQVGLTGETVPLSAIVYPVGEGVNLLLRLALLLALLRPSSVLLPLF